MQNSKHRHLDRSSSQPHRELRSGEIPAFRCHLDRRDLLFHVIPTTSQYFEFLRRKAIAAEIEKVIDSITAKHFSRDQFLKPLDRFYKAIEEAALTQTGYTEKQHFLNAVYEKFFQSFDPKQSDTHGIVYTPQPIVDFMVRSVEDILQQEFKMYEAIASKRLHSPAVQCSLQDRQFIIGSAIEQPTGDFFSHASPLFEEEADFLLLAIRKNLLHPILLQFSRTIAALTSNYYPVDSEK